MVIDDEAPVRLVIGMMLRRAGYEVTEFDDGDKAVAAFAGKRPDLVITDMLMPARDGIEIVGQFRRRAPGIPIIAISGGGKYIGSTEVLHAAAMLGVQQVLPKPFTMAELLSAVRTLLG